MSSLDHSNVLHNDDESFIILGTSPGTSLDAKCNGLSAPDSLTKVQIEEAIKDLPAEANMAFKAQFQLGECPSVASMMVASSIITDDKSTEDLQKNFGELLDENVLLKETLKQNNESMKQQFLLIASCQEDMMKTHTLHKEKFDETRMLVEKLRNENKKLKLDIVRLADMDSNSSQAKSAEFSKSSAVSAVEFVTSPDDDVINKLTAQLELVEKQRRQVIVENERLTWQKESLENILDATSKERDELKDKLRNAQLQLGSLDNQSGQQISKLKTQIEELQHNLMVNSMNISPEEVSKRDNVIRQLENKISVLQNDLKTSQLKILELESVKLEFSKYKSGVTDTVKMYKDQIQDVNCRLREAQTTVFQPVRFSVSPEKDSNDHSKLATNLKIYDKTLKHLSDMLNSLTNGTSDCLVQLLGSVASLQEYKLERTSADTFKTQLLELRTMLEKQHSAALHNIANVRGTMTVLNDIFKDYNEVLNKTKQHVPVQRPSNVDALTAALVARGQEIQNYEEEINKLREHHDDVELLKAQLELYKSDFEAEREAREKMASEKETILTDLRKTQRRNQELVLQLEEVRKRNPNLYQTAINKKIELPTVTNSSSSSTASASTASSNGSTTTGNMMYTCPKCLKFSSHIYKVMEDHFDDCLDDF